MGKIEIVKLPLERGAPKEHRIPGGNTALSWARALGHNSSRVDFWRVAIDVSLR